VQERERGANFNATFTRRRFLQAAGGAAALITLGGALGCDPAPRARAKAVSAPAGQAWNFRSRPDLHPPVIEVIKQARDTAPGFVFIAPKNGPGEAGPGQDGCVILDNDGQPVWLRLLHNEGMDVMAFRAQKYKGETVLTWWEGLHTGYGQGEYVILDSSYRELARFGAGNGYEGDHHEFLITPQDTALITIYNKVPRDLTSEGDPVDDGNMLDGIAQEVDIEIGEVLFEWHSLEHVSLDESYTKLYDYFHINSIDGIDEDHLLISFRFPWSRQPIDDPAIAAELGADDEAKIYASWNGATDLATWQVLAGAGPDQLEPLASAPSQGFETVITVHTTEPYLGLKAMNGARHHQRIQSGEPRLALKHRLESRPPDLCRIGSKERKPSYIRNRSANSPSAGLRGCRIPWRGFRAAPYRRTRWYGLVRSPWAGTGTSMGREALRRRISCSLSCRI
jgi:hypothetical protein